jgi:aminoglycoside phosphotransferase (APT) family kinase protein
VTIGRIPAAEAAIEPEVLRVLLRAQHADLAERPITEVGSGWDNVLYRLGDDLLARLPRRSAAAELIAREQKWLAVLAPRLPLPIPVPLRVGRPDGAFPWPWSIVPWFAGEDAISARPRHAERAGRDLGQFLNALHHPAPADAPRNPVRGIPLTGRAAAVDECARQLDGIVDRARVLDAWHELAGVPPWPGPPLWIHGDLHPGNLLVRGGRLAAVIDFGDLAAGDPATDLAIAWMLLPDRARPIFRAAAAGPERSIDDDTWARARGWALALGLVFLASSADRPAMGVIGQTTIDAVLAERA